MKEQISVLIDGEADELERERALRALQSNPELLATWERYHLVRTAVRRELDVLASADLANRVRERLHQEHPDDSTRRPSSSKMVKYSVGVAIAASVAAIALVNLSPLVTPSSPGLARTTNNAPPRSTVAETRPLAPEQQRALNSYLVHHAEFSSASGVNTMNAYARVVGRDNLPTESNGAE